VRARKPQHSPMYYDDESGRSRRATATQRVGTETQAPARTEPGKTQRTI